MLVAKPNLVKSAIKLKFTSLPFVISLAANF
jgi:hypothetical protein